MKLMFRVYSLAVFRWWIHASYNTYDNCRFHNVVVMILGRGRGTVLIPSLK